MGWVLSGGWTLGTLVQEVDPSGGSGAETLYL